MGTVIETIKYAFNDHVSNIIISFLSHPTADLMKEHIRHKELCSFDEGTDWTRYQKLYGWTKIRKVKHYLTYGGGPEGGVVRFRRGGWHVWHRDWGGRADYVEIPEELEVVYYDNENGVEAVKLVPNDYQTGDCDRFWDEILEGQDEEESESEEEEEEEEEDDDNVRCSACLELWEDCQCWCSNCDRDMTVCRYTCGGFQ